MPVPDWWVLQKYMALVSLNYFSLGPVSFSGVVMLKEP
jgi:hypothetical protein